MITISIRKMHTNQLFCDNDNCKHLPEYTDYHKSWFANAPGPQWTIKEGSICAMVGMKGSWVSSANYYCRDCIDDIYQLIKSQMDTNLWAFK